MDEFVCLTVASEAGESEAAFKGRLTAFWTHMLRTRPDEYETVYSEATAFERDGGRLTRQYMVTAAGLAAVTAELTAKGLAFDPVDEHDHYSKAEASSPDWFQIPHD